MSQEVEYQTERLDHLGIVAGVCQEAGIAEWLDKRAGESRRSVSIGREYRKGHGGDGPQWARVQQSTTVPGAAVF